jgi:hypothetical protein
MVPPRSIKYLTPATGTVPPKAGVTAVAAAKVPPTSRQGSEQAVEQWSSVKRQLGSRP